MVEILINNQLIDLSGDERIEADYSVFDISKIGSRSGVRSYSFTVPKTNRNKTVFESSEQINNLSVLPYRRLRCVAMVDGSEVGIKFCEVESVKEGYSLRLYGGNSDIFNDIKNLTWEDLREELSVYDHFWDMETIVASRTNTEGYIYSIIDFHSDSPNAWFNNDNKHIRVEGLLPCFFYNTLLEIIFTKFGHTFINDIEEDTADLIICDGKPELRNQDKRRYNAYFQPLGAFLNGTGNLIGLASLISTEGTFYKPGAFMEWDNWNLNLSFVDNVKLRVTAKFFVTNITASDSDISLYVSYTTINGGVLFSNPQTFTIPANATFYEINVDYDMDDTLIRRSGEGIADAPFIDFWGDGFNAVGIEQSGYIRVQCLELYNEDVVIAGETIEAHPQLIFDTDLVDNSHLFNYITASTLFPNLSPMDVVKNYMQMFGLIPIQNEIDGTVTLIEFDKIRSNISMADDWSDKLDFSEEPEIKFILDGYGQENKLTYTKDGDEEKPPGTDGTILIDNKNLELEKEVVQLNYAPTNKVKRLVDIDVCQVGYFKELEYSETKVPRVLINKLYSSADLGGDVVYEDSVLAQETTITTDIPIPYFIKAGQDLNLGFLNNLLVYYELISDVLQKAKIITPLIRLNASDINQLDFSKPVYISHFESFFYKSAIKGFPYTESRSTLVELVKLNIHG